MPKLKSEMAELYCVARAEGQNKTEAHARAGYAATSRQDQGAKSRKLESKAHIQARIIELTDVVDVKAMKKAGLSKEQVMSTIKDVIDEARERGKLSEALAGAKLYGTELKMFNQQIEIKGFDHHLDGQDADGIRQMLLAITSNLGQRLVDMSPEETRAYIRKTAPLVGLRIVDAEGDGACTECGSVSQDIGVSTLQ